MPCIALILLFLLIDQFVLSIGILIPSFFIKTRDLFIFVVYCSSFVANHQTMSDSDSKPEADVNSVASLLARLYSPSATSVPTPQLVGSHSLTQPPADNVHSMSYGEKSTGAYFLNSPSLNNSVENGGQLRVPDTVRLLEEESVAPSINDKRYQMGFLSKDPFQFMDTCRHIIGKSGGFCIIKNCPINHQGTTPETLKVGTCYVV